MTPIALQNESIIFFGISLTDWKDIATIIGAVVAGATLIKVFLEYSFQGKQKRAEHFFNLRKKLKDNLTYKNICSLVDVDSIELDGVPYDDKRDFLGLFEEIAIMAKSGLIRQEIAFYMFGYYAIKCWESEHFWSSVNRESKYWKVFKEFALEAKRNELNDNNFYTGNIKI